MTSDTNRAIFERMLAALGRKDYDAFQTCLAPEIICQWPYRVIEGFPTELVGARRLREALETSLKVFTPYNYKIVAVHALARADGLIAEYTSHSTYLPRGVAYSNQYVGIVEFRDSKITLWREYVNPLIVLEALGPGFAWHEGKGVERNS